MMKENRNQKNEILLRKMTIEDIPAVHEVEVQSFSIPWSEKAFEESLGYSHAIFLVAEWNGSIAGYVGMYQVFHEGDIINVAVAQKYRRMGVGKALMQGIISVAAERGIQNLTLEVRESNQAAIHLYSSFGFISAGIRKDFYEKPRENAVIMWKKDVK